MLSIIHIIKYSFSFDLLRAGLKCLHCSLKFVKDND